MSIEKDIQYRVVAERITFLLDSISPAIEQQDNVLAMRSKLHLQILLLVIEKECLYHLILPQSKVRLT